ncbi:hypothetical protein BDV3_004787 [Batrachochytrium dendrobatidis]|nr:transcriptional activator hap3 [Batrachochytrium dendrobatidis]KAK5671066.1 transcriptional activator hap3 [Batrachochytrium dendrobatidis]
MSENAHRRSKDDDHEQDRLLPIANVARIMKRGLPENAKIAKEAKECIQECVSEFISFVTSEASDRCAQEKRKTINGEDILWAMHSLGFETYTETLRVHLQKYREHTAKSERTNKLGDSADLQQNNVTSGMNILDQDAIHPNMIAALAQAHAQAQAHAHAQAEAFGLYQ